MSVKWTCQCNVGTDEEPDLCGRPAEWWDEDASLGSWPVCGTCSDGFSFPLEEAGPKEHAEWIKYLEAWKGART